MSEPHDPRSITHCGRNDFLISLLFRNTVLGHKLYEQKNFNKQADETAITVRYDQVSILRGSSAVVHLEMIGCIARLNKRYEDGGG